MDDYILEMRNITKEFPGVKALDNVSFSVKRGEIHALCGENGAGKSTLMKVLSGVYPSRTYSGDIVINGKVVAFVSEGAVGNGRSGHAKVMFLRHDYTHGKCHIALGTCFDSTSEQARKNYESMQKGGSRMEVGYVD